ncbi:hypothetical protein [Paraburkholderia bannensis]|uniref:hypothetical protein n=1 Tax=Paraburkholderia bannensis TaxID=765414 RepID=UPI002ABE91F5|nr:hypothetical protein [Paraburkholderia bannensis]
MSFNTRVWVYPCDGEPLNVASTRDELVKFLDERALSHDVLKNLMEAGQSALPTSIDFYLDSWSIIDLFTKLAQCLPDASFAVKGSGEEARDVWSREYSNGIVTFEAGPFHD